MDYPGIHEAFRSTSSQFYLRLHGSPKLFESSYSDERLADFYKGFPPAEGIAVYFNNDKYGAAYQNASALKRIIGIG